MIYPKFSVVISYDGDMSCFGKSMDYIFVQKYPIDGIEVVVVNTLCGVNETLNEFEKKHSESVILVNSDNKISTSEAWNVGIEYCTGDYVLFVNSGDVLNIHLFEGIAKKLSDDRPDLVCFKTTSAMQEFELFSYESFDVTDANLVAFDDIRKKKSLLNSSEISENYHAYAYKREFLQSSGQRFQEDEFEEENTFVYPLLLLAQSILQIPEHGYCHFYVNGKEGDFIREVRIRSNLRSQLELYGLFKSLPDLFADYHDLIDAHFLRRYFIHTIELFRGGLSSCLSIHQFLLMQITCLKLVPQWISNDYIYSFSRRELDWLGSLSVDFKDVEQLRDEFCSDAMISVIMTTYNRAYVLQRGISNVLQQSWQNFEFIIVNDNSEDQTEDVILSFSDPRIRYIKNNENRGVAFARNLGLKQAKGEFVIFQDDDDMSRLDKLEKMIKRISNVGEAVGAVYHETVMYTESDNACECAIQIIPDRKKEFIRKNGFVFPALLPKNFIALPAILMKKKYLDKLGYFDERLVAYEDWELCLRLSKEYDFLFINEIMYDYFRSESGLISDKSPEHREKILQALYLIDLSYEKDRKKYNIASNFRIIDG